ncbi:amino acid adenylation domain-containing protein [Streptomyces sp. TRM S81-3]|uniref:Amino acid adenylation domain-containing protein n=1 Tax=Streptomyces griseicoloratus TaxID=2752516 RepID=A0A926QR25_9ACTN|nr:amino acid adenylation domain-containing protein [Streptomyces griseicoloratus]MBD0420461.1 amino acid adenylation domain-containing protein [Streptomyces griseicoloratus]
MPPPPSARRTAQAALEIVAEVLRVPGADGTESFYDLGGTSLQAMRICARLAKDLHLHASPEDLFEADTLTAFTAGLTPTAGPTSTAGPPRGPDSTPAPAARHTPTAPHPAARRSLHAAVTHQARLRPTALALIHGDERVDYATLDAASDTYAGELAGAGVHPGAVVPVLLPRSPRLVAVLLAVLKCGASYAALDPRWPAPRIHDVVSRLHAPLTVAEQDIPHAWAPPAETLRQAAARRIAPPGVTAAPDDAATVFFTSGTTGVPKGVLSPHRATTRLFPPDGATFADFGPGRVVLQAAPAPWDAFSLELWGPLTSGGTCAIAPGDHLLPDTLTDLVARAGVDTVWLTSALFNLFVDEDTPDRPCFAGIRQVLTGGERMSPAHAGRFLARHPGTVLINGYGPVESCVFATTHRVTAADCARPDGVPVGVPVPGTTVHILDGDRPAAPGEPGEICLAGDGLALGYLDDAEATAASFTTHLLDGTPLRLYRTGDLGVMDTDGTLHFRGRTDRQVKIAGHRVEPDEIETVARRVPGVRDAAVVPVPAPAGGYERLALFYTSNDRDDPSHPAVVRRALAARLPGPLVPRTVRRCASLPTTANGKLDRRALPAWL